jgi:RHS repeat-associated protein
VDPDSSRGWPRAAGVVAATLSVALVVGWWGGAQPAFADTVKPKKVTAEKTRSVAPGKVKSQIRKAPADPTAAVAVKGPAKVSWPAASDTTVALSAKRTRVGDTPVSVAAGNSGNVHVKVLDHATAEKAGHVLEMQVGRTDGKSGKVDVAVDYSGFAKAYGAGWSDRLQLVEVPAQGRPVVLPSTRTKTTVTASVALNSTNTTLALTSGPSGSAGDFTATPLKASSTWAGGSQSGTFTWTYPMRTPPVATGPHPDLALNYSSQSVDGLMAASNNQPSWVGEGFSFQPGTITRNYKACLDDMGGTATNKTKTGDLCFGTQNATLSMPGHSGELIKDDGDGHWSLKDDDGSKVQLLTGATNGDNDGEYWKVTTSDGTQYYFGLNHLTGWATGNPTTNSTYTVPVYGNNSGEPCYNATFSSAACNQAWQWNLDYVVDVHGNTESLWYTQETGKYAKNLTSSSIASYTRGGYLTRIDYGTDQRTGGKDSDLSAKAPYKVDFAVADRCATPGTTCVSSTPSNWPDTPWDQNCTSTTSCTDYSPTFWTQKRLDSVQTSVLNGTAYDAVEKWTMHQTYPDPGDSTRAGLWLSSISHSGLYGSTVDMPDIQFTGIQLQNRVDTATDATPKMNWWRIASIKTETGELIGVSYSAPQCVAGSTPSPDANTSRCYPIFWTRPGDTTPKIDWFHKYVVTAVSENDLTGGAPRVYTTYTYGTPAWHYDEDNGLVPASRKTWAQWRGYDYVTTTVGDTGDPQTSTKVHYFQGMNGDKTSSGTRSVQVTDSTGTKVNDDDTYAGTERESITYNGPGGAEVSGEIDDPWKSAAIATRTVNGYTVSAYRTGTAATHSRIDLDGGRAPQRTEVDTTLDAYGMPTQTWNKGDITTSADDTCEIVTYNRNTTANILDKAGRTQKYAKPCGTSPASQDDVISDVENSFDNLAYGTAPTKGDVTKVQKAKAWTSASSITWLTTETNVYDALGRVTDTTDVRGNHTLTAFTPATGGPVTSTKTTENPLGWTTTTEIAPGYGLTTGSVDENNKRTDTTYDGLGRQTAVWSPTRAKATQSANATFSYQISQTAPSVVTTQTLNATVHYTPTYDFYDGLLRERQKQTIAPGGGRQITDTFYNSTGKAVKTSGPYFNGDAPGTTLFPVPVDQSVPMQSVTTFDGAGREINTRSISFGFTQWHTITAYGGDHTDVTPVADAAPASAGTPTSTITDALGRTIESRQYPGSTVSGTQYNSTKYGFNEKGENTSVTDAAGNQWSYKYDLLGRKISSSDPDSGTTLTSYNDAGDVTSTTDALNQTLSYDYTLPAGYADPKGRKTALWQGAIGTGTKLATWTYDTVSKNQVSATSRFVGTNEYKTSILGYNNLYQPAASTVTIPASEGNLAGNYSFSTTYNLDGSINSQSIPATSDLLAENLNYSYDSATGKPFSLKTDYGGTTKMIVLSTEYTSFGEPGVTTFADSTTSPFAQQSLQYEPGTRRLIESKTLRSNSPSIVGDVHYSYDAAGEIISASDTPSGGTANTQCYTYDGLSRLTSAWTPDSGDCTAAPTVAGLGGAAPYWKSWTFDGNGIAGSTGNRLTETTHAAGGDTTVTSAYGQAGHPHGVSSTTTTTGGTQTGTASYSYDADGHTSSRTGPGAHGQQTLKWDAENHLSSLTDSSGSYSYVYNTDGSRLLEHDPLGATLYVGSVQLRLTTSTAIKTAQRYYTFNDQTVAQRTAAGVQFLSDDKHGTSLIAIDDTSTQTVTKRYQDPYGNQVAISGAWTGTKTFVGGDQDPTGLEHIGAREYDAALGRFISRDPIVDTKDAQQMNGYEYSASNPVCNSDPTGEMYMAGDGPPPHYTPAPRFIGPVYHPPKPRFIGPVYTPPRPRFMGPVRQNFRNPPPFHMRQSFYDSTSSDWMGVPATRVGQATDAMTGLEKARENLESGMFKNQYDKNYKQQRMAAKAGRDWMRDEKGVLWTLSKGKWAKVGGHLGDGAMLVGAVATYSSEVSEGHSQGQAATAAVASAAGGYYGAEGGAWAGAAIGTMICPGAGTVIGGIVGGVIGGFAGGWLAQKGVDSGWKHIFG